MDQKIKLMVADDQHLFRKSLISLLKEAPDMEVAAEAENGKQLIDLLKHNEPDIVLLDVEMPVMDGKTALEIIVKRFSKVKVIVLSVHYDAGLVSDFMGRGASCYLTKNCQTEMLFDAIRVVKTKGHYFDASVSKAMLDSIQREKSNAPFTGEVVLNDREIDIMKRICDGKTNKEIASSLNLSASTIDFHRSKIYSKTHSNNITQLLKFALKSGIVDLP